MGRRTSEAAQRIALERFSQLEEGFEDGEEEPEEAVPASPLEVLDRLVQQGSDAHDKALKRLPLPSKSADWTHFGGTAPQDELRTLRGQLLLLHGQLQYERYKREQHAVRNRRLLRRIINATALEEQNIAMKDQLNIQSVDVLSLRESLQVEQQRYRQLWEDRETVVTRLHCQVRQLQQSRDDYYTKNQELQGKLQEGQKKVDRLEAELQRANNKVCHTGHLLNQMNIKLSTSESTQQQMSFLNKQLLLLGEVHKLSSQDAARTGPHNAKETKMVQETCNREVERLKQSLVVQGQKLEAAQQRALELDTHLSKKEHLVTEQKKFLEDVKCQAKAELQASESRYQAQLRVTQTLQAELLHLYSRVEREPAASCSSGALPPGGSPHPHTSTQTSPVASERVTKANGRGEDPEATPPLLDAPHSNGNASTLSPGRPKVTKSTSKSASPSAAAATNGNEDALAPFLVEPPTSCSHGIALALAPGAPLTVGSYPSAKSFLGMRARELFRNKSESQCDEEEGEEDRALPPLAGLAHVLKTELCVEATSSSTPLIPGYTHPVDPTKPPGEPWPSASPRAPSASPRAPLACLSGPLKPAPQGPALLSLTVSPRQPAEPRRQRSGSGGSGGQESPRRKAGPGRAGGGGGGRSHASTARPRQQQLKIMDYNEPHQEHS